MEINNPQVLAEVTQIFEQYEKALVNNDVVTLAALFWQTPQTVRYGGAENLYGYEEIANFRANRASSGLNRTLAKTVITTFGQDTATASTLFYRDSAKGKVGRQMQTWVRMDDGWKVVAGHISIIDDVEN